MIEDQAIGDRFGAPMSGKMTRNEILQEKLIALKTEHRDLDAAILSMEGTLRPDVLALKRLKKRKLLLKDGISRIEDELTPDIIA